MGSIAPLFFEGSHREVVERTLDSTSPQYEVEDFPYIVGALVMLGRIEEAETSYLLRHRQLSTIQRVAARFFLGVGFCRHSYYEKAIGYFAMNLRSRKEIDTPLSRFYRFQGQGFYHFFAGDLGKASKASAKSFEAALEAEFLYGRAFAADLKGHCLVMTGNVSQGLSTLSLAEKLAGQLGARWLQETIQSSVLTYRVQFGIEAGGSVSELHRRLERLSRQDIYTQSTLLLELAQTHMREGRVSQAKEVLNDCCRIVYGSNNRRHAALLNLRYAYVHLLEGETHLALNLVRNALTQIDSRVDRCLELRLRGFERRLVKLTGVEICEKALEERLVRLTNRVGEAVRMRMLGRARAEVVPNIRPGEDAIGDLFDLMARDSERGIEEILRLKYYGLLAEIVPVPRGSRALYLDLEPGSLTVFDRGNVIHLPDSLSRSLRLLLLELRRGPRTKEDLIREVWKYDYHPLRHDPLIYSAIAKLRKVLGERSHWIEASENGYHLRSGVVVVTGEAATTSELPEPVVHQSPGPSLNSRQQKILRFLGENEYIDTNTCRELFQTSEVTASRDLSELLRLSLVERVGRGRATKYARRVSNPNNLEQGA